MYMNLLEYIEGVYVSAYFKSQTFLSFFLSATWFQSWVPNAKRHNTPQFRAFSHFHQSITQNIFLLCLWNLKRQQRGFVSLHISNLRPLSISILFLATGSISWNPDMQNTQFEPYSYFHQFQDLVTNLLTCQIGV